MTDYRLDYHGVPGSQGAIEYAYVPWDSELFGLSVYELRIVDPPAGTFGVVRDWLAQLDTSCGCLVCTKIDQRLVPAIRALSQNGFYPVETMLEMEADLEGRFSAGSPEPLVPVSLRRTTSGDLDSIVRIASAAFWSDRFHLDPNLSNQAADERYARWIQRAFDDGDPLLTFERTDDEKVIGFYHLRPISEETVDLVLAALDPALAGQGLGFVLYRSAIDECTRMGFSRAQTRVVARNLPVLNILTRLGFSFRGAMTSLHWYAGPTDSDS